jgi:hypothetical protein
MTISEGIGLVLAWYVPKLWSESLRWPLCSLPFTYIFCKPLIVTHFFECHTLCLILACSRTRGFYARCKSKMKLREVSCTTGPQIPLICVIGGGAYLNNLNDLTNAPSSKTNAPATSTDAPRVSEYLFTHTPGLFQHFAAIESF